VEPCYPEPMRGVSAPAPRQGWRKRQVGRIPPAKSWKSRYARELERQDHLLVNGMDADCDQIGVQRRLRQKFMPGGKDGRPESLLRGRAAQTASLCRAVAARWRPRTISLDPPYPSS